MVPRQRATGPWQFGRLHRHTVWQRAILGRTSRRARTDGSQPWWPSGDASQPVVPALQPDDVAIPDESASEPDAALPDEGAMCCEVALDVFQTAVTQSQDFLWAVLEECAAVEARPGQKRRVEVSFRRLKSVGAGKAVGCQQISKS